MSSVLMDFVPDLNWQDLRSDSTQNTVVPTAQWRGDPKKSLQKLQKFTNPDISVLIPKSTNIP